jgi:hypothetical protein
MNGQTFPACARSRCVSFEAPRSWTQRLENVAAVRNLLGFHRQWMRSRELRYAALVSILDDYDAHKPRDRFWRVLQFTDIPRDASSG